MSKSTNHLEWVTISGEILIVIGAALWITGWEPVRYIFAIGALIFATGRLLMPHEGNNVTLRRLYTQQNIGAIFAIISALLMFFYDKLNGFEITDYVIEGDNNYNSSYVIYKEGVSYKEEVSSSTDLILKVTSIIL